MKVGVFNMAEKMLKVAGRDSEGLAKPLSVSKDGNLITNRRKLEVVTLLDNELIVANGDSGNLNPRLDGTEKEVWVFLTNTKAPLLLTGRSLVGGWSDKQTYAGQADNFYPNGRITELHGEGVSGHPTSTPRAYLYIPNGLGFKANENDTPQNYEEARRNIIGYREGAGFRIYNQSGEDVLVSAWAVKIYE